MSHEGFDEYRAAQFISDIRRRPTASHPIEQLAHAQVMTDLAQANLDSGKHMSITYEAQRIGLYSDTRILPVKEQFVGGMKKVVQTLRRGNRA